MKEVSAYKAWKSCKYPERTALVTSVDKNGKANIMVVGWNTQVSFNPFLIAISVGLTRHTHKLISETKEFVLAFPSEGMEDVVNYCGTHSGRNVDKFKETGLTKVKAKHVKPPLIRECVVNMECKVVDEIRTGDHTVFIGKVLAAYISKGKNLFRTRNGKFETF